MNIQYDLKFLFDLNDLQFEKCRNVDCVYLFVFPKNIKQFEVICRYLRKHGIRYEITRCEIDGHRWYGKAFINIKGV